jgi:two-component system cell cycle response regulator
MPSTGSRIYTLDIIGFSAADRTLIASMFALSRRRNFQYEQYRESSISLVPRERPDLFLVDVDSLKSLIVLKSKSPDLTHPAVLIGSTSHGLEWTLVKRPIKWLELFEALDKSVERAVAAKALVPAENRRGWPFFDRRKRSRIDPSSEIKLAAESISNHEPSLILSTTNSIPTLSLLDSDTNGIADKPSNLSKGRATFAHSVLIVDNEDNSRLQLQKQLEQFDVNVDFAASGEQALGRVARKHYACILLDVCLPGIGAYEVCRLIKSETRQAPSVVMLSANSNPLDRVRARLAGCDAFLEKPLNHEILSTLLQPYAAPKTQATVSAASP